jgi:hypothetical protein
VLRRPQRWQQGGKIVQQQGGRQPLPQQTGPVQQENLASKLSSATSQEQKQILGEHLYPLISNLCKEEHVGKVFESCELSV